MNDASIPWNQPEPSIIADSNLLPAVEHLGTGTPVTLRCVRCDADIPTSVLRSGGLCDKCIDHIAHLICSDHSNAMNQPSPHLLIALIEHIARYVLVCHLCNKPSHLNPHLTIRGPVVQCVHCKQLSATTFSVKGYMQLFNMVMTSKVVKETVSDEQPAGDAVVERDTDI